MSLSDRFRHLERARPTGEEESASVVTPARFDVPDAAQTPELQADSNDQPFVRCCICEGDNNAHATTCVHCGSSLETLEQRQFNDRLWAERLAQKRREEEELAAREQEGRAQAALEEANRRLLGEQLAREVAEDYRQKDRWWSGARGLGTASPGSRMLELVPERWRTRVIATLVAIPALLVLLAPRNSTPAFVGFIWLLILGVLFAPPAVWRYRGRRWWDD